MFVFSRIKAIRIATSLSCELKTVKKVKPVLYTPLYMIINFFWSFFLGKARILSLKLYTRVKRVKTRHVCTTLKSLDNFSISTAYLVGYQTFVKKVWKIWMWLEKWLSHLNSAREELTDYWKFILGIFFADQCYHYFLNRYKPRSFFQTFRSCLFVIRSGS